jgi:hypothetical protein
MGKKLGRRMGKALVAVVERIEVWTLATTENRMAVYMIAYELHDGEDYEGLIEGIKISLRKVRGIISSPLGSSSARNLQCKSTIHYTGIY